MNAFAKIAIYVGLSALSWRSGFGKGTTRLPELEEITYCASIGLTEWRLLAETYAAHACYYGYELVSPHRDASLSVHHAATILLVAMSWTALGTGGIRVGTLVMFLHSTTDIMIQLMRLTPMAVPKILAAISVLVSWAVCRLWYFGNIIYLVYGLKEQNDADCGTSGWTLTCWIATITLLCVLFCLNCYWFIIIAAKLYAKMILCVSKVD